MIKSEMVKIGKFKNQKMVKSEMVDFFN